MKIRRIRVQNFKGFRDSGWIELSPNFNIVVGQNNSGKSALLDALMLRRASPNPHRNSIASDAHEISGTSFFSVDIGVTLPDLIEAFGSSGVQLNLPVEIVPGKQDLEYYSEVMERLEDLTLEVDVTAGGGARSRKTPSNGSFSRPHDGSVRIFSSPDRRSLVPISVDASTSDNIVDILQHLDSRRIVYVGAQRATRPFSPVSADVYLEKNAENLPSVLSSLQNGAPKLFERLLGHIREIFPSIQNITILPHSSGPSNIEIRLWPSETQDKISQSISMSESGTGVAQALAILYVVVFYKSAIIIVDEINSFLHPSAVKTLLRIIRTQYDHHQYVISTHSTEVIAWSDPEKVLFTRKAGEESAVSSVDWKDALDVREISRDLGVSMVDVFGANRIVWLEGETEEICFPMLLSGAGHQLPRGTVMTKVIGTGNLTLDARGVELAYSVYRKISQVAAPLVDSAVFSLDREGMSASQVKKLLEKSGADLRILPRRCIENYLLNPDALSAFLNHLGENVGASIIQNWIETHGVDQKYKARSIWNKSPLSEEWYQEVDAAKLLSDLVQSLTDGRYIYRKTAHSPWILQWIIEHNPDWVDELTQYVKDLVLPEG